MRGSTCHNYNCNNMSSRLVQVRDAVWSLSLQSAGIQVGFATNSANVYIDYTTADIWEPMGVSLQCWFWFPTVCTLCV